MINGSNVCLPLFGMWTLVLCFIYDNCPDYPVGTILKFNLNNYLEMWRDNNEHEYE